jgi:pectate lyase
MRRIATLAIFLGFLTPLLASAPAHAQATRTWVSGVGDDVNPCSRTAPCKTFAGAISKTAAGGEIDCLDPGGFGALTITKSITLDCGGGGIVGSILASAVNGINVNAAGGNVIIRNLSINGAGTALGIRGVNVLLSNIRIS